MVIDMVTETNVCLSLYRCLYFQVCIFWDISQKLYAEQFVCGELIHIDQICIHGKEALGFS